MPISEIIKDTFIGDVYITLLLCDFDRAIAYSATTRILLSFCTCFTSRCMSCYKYIIVVFNSILLYDTSFYNCSFLKRIQFKWICDCWIRYQCVLRYKNVNTESVDIQIIQCAPFVF